MAFTPKDWGRVPVRPSYHGTAPIRPAESVRFLPRVDLDLLGFPGDVGFDRHVRFDDPDGVAVAPLAADQAVVAAQTRDGDAARAAVEREGAAGVGGVGLE